MKSSKDMARSKPGQAKPTPNGRPVTGNGKPSGTSAQAGSRPGSNQSTMPRPSSTSSKGVATGRPTAGVTGTRPGSSQRPRALPPKKAPRLRPVDMIITGVAVLVIGLIVWAVWSSANPSATASDPNNPDPAADLLKNGTQAPDFTLPANDGNTYSLSQFKGKPVLMEFMAPWCPHCQEDSSILNQVYDTYNSKGLAMIAINASPYGRNHENNDDTPITMDDQKWFAQTFNVKYPMLFDSPLADGGQGHPDTKLRQTYGVDYYPSLYVLDKNGVIANHIVADATSAITYERISAEVDKVLK